MGNLLFDDLREELSRKRAVIVVGAGLSMLATENAPCASWVGLLKDGAERCAELEVGLRDGWLDRVRGEIESRDMGELLSAATKITGKLGGRASGEYARWLRESVGLLRASGPGRETLEAVGAFEVPIVTTNYDSLLEEVTGIPPVPWTDRGNVDRFLRGDERGIVHLHGHWSQPRSVVLDIPSYDNIRSDEYMQAVLRGLQLAKTLVFLGYGDGLRDPNLGTLLAWAAEVRSHSEYRNFRLTLDQEREVIQTQHPGNQRIVVLGYGSRHEDLVKFLRSLRSTEKPKPYEAAWQSKTSKKAGVPTQNEYFRGRGELLGNIRKGFQSPVIHVQALFGLGGIGKTSVATEYCYRFQDDYRHLLWVRASSSSELSRELRSVLKELAVSDVDLKDASELQKAIKDWLDAHDQWLLVFDNADNASLVAPCVPLEIRGQILLTSRVRAFQALQHRVEEVEIEKLEPEHAANFLKERTGNRASSGEEIKALRALVRELDGLPLALEQAAAYMAAKKAPFSDYLADYLGDPLNVLDKDWGEPMGSNPSPEAADREPLQLGDAHKSIRITWNLNFAEVSRYPRAADILKLTAFLAADNIPFELIANGFDIINSSVQLQNDFKNKRLPLHELLQPLETYSLIHKDLDLRTYSVHRLVQLVLRDGMSADDRSLWAVHAVDVVSRCFPEPTPAARKDCERLVSHAVECKTLIQDWGMPNEQAETLLGRLATFLETRGQIVLLEEIYATLLPVLQKRHGKSSVGVADTLVNQARMYNKQHRYSEAEQTLTRAISIFEKQRKRDPRKLAISLNNLAVIYSKRGRLDEAEEQYRKVILILEGLRSATKDDRLELSKVLSNLGSLIKKQSRDQESEQLFRRATELRGRPDWTSNVGRTEYFDRQSDGNVPEIEMSEQGVYEAYDLGIVYESQGRYSEAEHYYELALDYTQKLSMEGHAIIPASYSALARVYERQKSYTKAEELYKHTLVLEARRPGGEQPDTTNTRTALARMLVGQSRLSEGRSLLETSLRVCEKQLGADHLETAGRLQELADVCVMQGDVGYADQLYSRALKIRKAALGSDDEQTLNTLNRLAWVYFKERKYAEAERLFKRFAASAKRTFGAKHIRTAQRTQDLALLYMRWGNLDKAERLFKEAIQIQEAAEDSEPAEFAEAFHNLGTIYAETNRYADAQRAYRQAINLRDQALGADDEQTIASVSELVGICRKLEQYTEAEKLSRRLLDSARRTFGPDGLEVARREEELAQLNMRRTDGGDAENLLQDALRIRRTAQNSDPLELAEALSSLGLFYAATKNKKKAADFYARAVEIRDKHSDGYDPRTQEDVTELARLYAELDHPDAGSLVRRLRDVARRIFGFSHSRTRRLTLELAKIYIRRGEQNEAEDQLNELLSVGDNEPGSDPIVMAEAYELLANICLRTNREMEAASLYGQAVERRDGLLQEDDKRTIQIVEGLATLCTRLEQYDRANNLRRRLRDYSFRMFGSNSREAAKRRHELAFVLMRQNDRTEAESELRQVIKIREVELPCDLLGLAEALDDLALICKQTDRIDEAKRLHKRSLGIRSSASADEAKKPTHS